MSNALRVAMLYHSSPFEALAQPTDVIERVLGRTRSCWMRWRTMANDLRLSAVVDDKFSAPLKKLQEQLKEVGGREHVARMKEQAEAFKRVHESVVKVGDEMKRVLEPAMTAVGLSAAGLGGGLAGLVKGVRTPATRSTICVASVTRCRSRSSGSRIKRRYSRASVWAARRSTKG